MSRWVTNRAGESRNDGTKMCSEVGHGRDHMRRRRNPASLVFSQAAMLACSSSAVPIGRVAVN